MALVLLLSAAQIAAMLSVIFRLHRLARCDGRYTAFNPLAALIALAILLHAMSKRFSSKGIVWKGTRYPTRR